MRMLYLSCHEILEYDEISLFHELGVDVFSPGAYISTVNRHKSSLRPDLPQIQYDPKDLEIWNRGSTKDHLRPDIVERFDVVMVMHTPTWVRQNWGVIKNKRVIWRTIGQSSSQWEAYMGPFREQGMEIVRYSPREERLPNYLGGDSLIRFYKDPKEFTGWTGERKVVINFTQSMVQRGSFCCFPLFDTATLPFHRELYGSNSEVVGYGKGRVSFDELKHQMRQNRVYFYTGTHPASYTLNFIEAWMTGIPVVAVGPFHGNAPSSGKPAAVGDPDPLGTYEVHDLIENGVSGFSSDHETEIQDFMHRLMGDDAFAQQISDNGRAKAIEYFGKEKIKQQWKTYLEP